MRKKRTVKSLILGAVAAQLALLSPMAAQAEEIVNVYSFRQKTLIQPLLDRFTERTGISVRLLSGKADTLFERLKSEGVNSPADILMTSDAGRLLRAQAAGLLQPVHSDNLATLVPAKLRDPEGYWFGLSVRARVIVTAIDRVGADEIKSYEDLADPKWKERICIRSSGNIYNQSLLASMIAHGGSEKATQWAQAVTDNMARKPQGGDRDQVKAVAAGECDVAVVNTYYLGQMAASDDDQKAVVAKVRVVWPNQGDRGTHVNISGAGMTRSAKHKDNAIKLLEFLASDEAQKIFAGMVKEYPLRDDIPLAPELEAWGGFKADDINLAAFGDHQQEAIQIFDRVGWR